MLDKQEIIEYLRKEPSIIAALSTIPEDEWEVKLEMLADVAAVLPCSANDKLDAVIPELDLLFREIFLEDNVGLTVTDDKLILLTKALQKHQTLLSSYPHYHKNYFQQIDSRTIAVSLRTLMTLIVAEIELDDDSYLADLIIIAGFLANKDKCTQLLEQLEKEIQLYAIAKGATLLDFKDGLKKLTDDPAKPLNKQKIVSGFFYQWAKENGYDKEKYARVKNLLNRGLFLKLLNDKTILKDTGVNAKHGVWSHVIQQYLIVEKCKKIADANNQTFVMHSPADIYAYLGRKCNKSPVLLEATTWDIIYDQDEIVKDFRSPEIISETLAEDAKNIDTLDAKYPILSQSSTRYKFARSRNTLSYVYFQPASEKQSSGDQKEQEETKEEIKKPTK